MVSRAFRYLPLWASLVLAWIVGDFRAQTHCAAETVVPEPTASAPAPDKPLASYQAELLDLAMQAATEIPLVPHIKDRSRAQECVVTACLQLEQPALAERYLEKIRDWRRGAAYADLAIYLVQHQRRQEVQPLLDKALLIAQAANLEEWRRDRIKVKIASAYALMGQREKAELLVKVTEPSESGKLTGVTDLAGPGDIEARLKQVREHIAKGVYDLTVNALESSIRLYARPDTGAEHRAEIEKLIRESSSNFPIIVRIELLLKLGRAALDHRDKPKAIALADEAQKIFDGATWPIEYQIPLGARLAEFRHRAGDADKARAAARSAWELFTRNKANIVDIERAQTILPLGAAFVVMNDKSTALAVFRAAATEGAVNPNARPRALDLVSVCCAMATQGVEPDKDLRERLQQMRKGLVQPW